MRRCLAVCAMWAGVLGSVGCGAVPPEVGQVRDSLSDATESVLDAGSSAVDHAGHAWYSAKNQVDEYINKTPLGQRRFMCEQEHGSWVEVIRVGSCDNKCTEISIGAYSQSQACEGEGKGATFENQCLHSAADGAWFFNDGPSVPHVLVAIDDHILRWNTLFWDAAVNHDYCYHHGAATYGYSRDTCDEQILDDLLAICAADLNNEAGVEFPPDTNREECGRQAHRAYMALVHVGEDNFAAMNTRVYYPAYEPIWRKRRLPEKICDDEMRELIRERPIEALTTLSCNLLSARRDP